MMLTLVILAALASLFAGESYVLRSSAPFTIVRSPVAPADPGNTVAWVAPAEAVQVLGCEDFKSDVAVRVRAANGETGYVRGGEFELVRQPVSYSSRLQAPWEATWSCRALFDARKR